MGWNSLPLVIDSDLGNIEPEATAAGSPWGAVTWSAQRTQAKRELKAWLEADFGLGAADRVLDRWNPEYAFRYTGGAYTDITTAAADDTEEDIDLAAALATVGTDRIYVGMRAEFDGLQVVLLDSLNAVSSVLTAKYWGPAGWTSLSATDGTASSGKTFAQSGRITWTVPTDWEPRRLNGTGDEYYWVEVSITVALTAGTSATQLAPTRMPEGLRLTACYLALGHILRGLAPQSANPPEWTARGDAYLERAGDLYARLKSAGSIPIDDNRNQVTERVEREAPPRTVRLARG